MEIMIMMSLKHVWCYYNNEVGVKTQDWEDV